MRTTAKFNMARGVNCQFVHRIDDIVAPGRARPLGISIAKALRLACRTRPGNTFVVREAFGMDAALDKRFEIDRFDHEGWHVCIYVAWNELDRRFAGRAELFLNGAMRCRIALAKGVDSDAEAAASLQHRSRE